MGLNPYSNGILSDNGKTYDVSGYIFVLILILMEYSLTLCKRVIYVFFSCFFTVGIPFTPESYFHQGDFFANVCEILFHSK